MATTHTIDAKGLRCPQPILQIILKLPQIHDGDLLVVSADCESFEDDIRRWCTRMDKTLLGLNTSGTAVTAQIQF